MGLGTAGLELGIAGLELGLHGGLERQLEGRSLEGRGAEQGGRGTRGGTHSVVVVVGRRGHDADLLGGQAWKSSWFPVVWPGRSSGVVVRGGTGGVVRGVVRRRVEWPLQCQWVGLGLRLPGVVIVKRGLGEGGGGGGGGRGGSWVQRVHERQAGGRDIGTRRCRDVGGVRGGANSSGGVEGRTFFDQSDVEVDIPPVVGIFVLEGVALPHLLR